MSDIRVNAGLTPPAVTEDNRLIAPQATRFGALFTADWRQELILAGRGFIVDVGTFSTPIVGGGNGTVVDLDQPEFVISVPSGTAIIPIRVSVECQTPLLATDADEAEIVLIVDKTAAYAADGTATAETPINMRTDGPMASGCTCISAATADITDPVHSLNLAHKVITGDMNGTPANALWGMLDLVYEPNNPPIIVGPAMLVGYWGGTVGTSGFAQVAYAEVPSTWIK